METYFIFFFRPVTAGMRHSPPCFDLLQDWPRGAAPVEPGHRGFTPRGLPNRHRDFGAFNRPEGHRKEIRNGYET